MPIVTFDYKDFIKLFGYEISKEELIDRLPMIGADFDKIEDDEISIEFFPNRPDLSCVEGIARASRAFFGFEIGLKKYPLEISDVVTNVDSSVKNIRPYVATALVKDVKMTDELVASLMGLQEKIHFGLGRNRKKVAIGVHNFEPISPPFFYKAVDPFSVQFIPLGKFEPMNLSEILEKHEKGVDYANLLVEFNEYPLITDSYNNVLSFPPIINGSLTEVTPFTKDLFIDVTGNDIRSINYALNIVVTSLAERGGKIFTTSVKYDDNTFTYPDLQTKKMKLKSDYVNKILGTNLNLNEIISCLKKMNYNANIMSDNEINVEIPPWRADILHDIDLVEDVAVGYGFDNFKIKKLNSLTFGQSLKNRDFFQGLTNILIGLGFNEVTTFTISNENDEYNKLGLKEKKHVIIENPIGDEYTCIRVGLIPSLLKILNENRHHPLPQKIFELGIIVDESFKNKYNLTCIKIGAKTNFTECKSIFETIMRGFGLSYELGDKDHSGFVNGRCASIIINNEKVGYFGELHPKTIKEFQLEYPIIAIEIQLNKLIK